MKTFIRQLTPVFLLSWYHLALAATGAFLYRFPSKELVVIGVTGTNGKSTVVDLVTKIFEEAGCKTASLSSIRFKIGEKEWPNTLKMTMPGRFKLQKFLRDAVSAGCRYVVIEVTSEGIKQWRHWGIDFDVAVFTNLTPEHIESHGSFEKYRGAKGRLFEALKFQNANSNSQTNSKMQIPTHKRTKISIVNLDDEHAEYFLKFDADEIYGYTIENEKLYSKIQNVTKTLTAKRYTLLPLGIEFFVDNTPFRLKLHGEFNVYNALAAICVGVSQEIDLGIIKHALEKIETVPGRFEIVIEKPFLVIVDYAHTPDALKNVYETVMSPYPKPYTLNPRMICVLGAAGGGRDKWKRPELGRIAEEYCGEIILTNEDPYDENPDVILEEIAAGFSQTPKYQKIFDRREAISRALSFARQGDIVVITGKGCEPWMMVAGGKKIHWDDRRMVREELTRLKIGI